MRLRSISLRGVPFALIFALLLAAPSKAQTGASTVSADYLRPGIQVIPGNESGQSAGNFRSEQRIEWLLDNTIGTGSLVAGAIGTEFGSALGNGDGRWSAGESFVRRYEMHLAGTATGNALEAASGAIWGEDPRYFRAAPESFGKRLRNVIRMTFVAYRSDGHLAPAYARYIGITGSSFLVDYWEPSGAASLHDAALYTLGGFLGRMGGNAFQEFWPSIKPHLLRHLPSMP